MLKKTQQNWKTFAENMVVTPYHGTKMVSNHFHILAMKSIITTRQEALEKQNIPKTHK